MADPEVLEYDRESVEFVVVAATVDGTPAVSGVSVAVTPVGDYPAADEYEEAATDDADLGFVSGPRQVGTYTVRVKVGNVVIRAGHIRIV